MKDRSSGTVCPGRALRDKTQEGFESGYFETAEKVQLDWLKESLSSPVACICDAAQRAKTFSPRTLKWRNNSPTCHAKSLMRSVSLKQRKTMQNYENFGIQFNSRSNIVKTKPFQRPQ